MRFPPSFIERLRSHFLMSEVVGRRIPIKKHGREFQGLCPFHNEKSPSFTVNDEKGFFHCFGCGAHGDAIEFIRKFERLSYPETVETLARDAGIPLPQLTHEEVRKIEAEKTLYDVLEATCQWFEKQLVATTGNIALDYLEKRGLKPETMRTFRIGYAPDERTALYNHLLKAGFQQSLQVEAGLIILPEQGAPYDRFRGRIMFPIRNNSGKIIAFGGRLIANATANKHLPKYLNSPETPLFKKGEILYNLDLAKKPARDGNIAVVMEGYMDVVSTAQSGIAYALATLGTAVTPEHLRLLWQLAKEPVMCLDGDAAGMRAMMRAAEVALPLLKPGYSLRFAILPKGEDPDSYVQKHGKASFEKILMGSRRLSQILWETVSPQYKSDLPEGRAALEDALKILTDKIANPTVRAHYASYFRKLLWSKPAGAPRASPERSVHVEQMVVQHHSAALEVLVQRLLILLLKFPQLLHKSQIEETLSRLDIRSHTLDALRTALLAAHGHVDIDDHEKFTHYMQKQFHGDLPTGAIKLPYRETLNAEDAMLLWNETVSVYQVAHLESELKELQESVGHSMDEAAYHRLVELQQAIRKAQGQRTFARAEPDVA